MRKTSILSYTLHVQLTVIALWVLNYMLVTVENGEPSCLYVPAQENNTASVPCLAERKAMFCAQLALSV